MVRHYYLLTAACYGTHLHLAKYYFLTKARRALSTQPLLSSFYVLTEAAPRAPLPLGRGLGDFGNLAAATSLSWLLVARVYLDGEPLFERLGLRPPSPLGVLTPSGYH